MYISKCINIKFITLIPMYFRHSKAVRIGTSGTFILNLRMLLSCYLQKDAIIAKLSTLKPNKDSLIKRDLAESRKGTTTKTPEKSQGINPNQVAQFGLKLKQRSDDYIPLFEDYED